MSLSRERMVEILRLRITDGVFRMPYRQTAPRLPGEDKDSFYARVADARVALRQETAELERSFKTEALVATGLSEHPKGEKAFRLAWEERHSSGHHDVLDFLVELAALLLD